MADSEYCNRCLGPMDLRDEGHGIEGEHSDAWKCRDYLEQVLMNLARAVAMGQNLIASKAKELTP